MTETPMADTGHVLAISPCQTRCDWAAVGAPDLFRCAGCGSEWLPTERWTPRQADGSIPLAVRQVLERA